MKKFWFCILAFLFLCFPLVAQEIDSWKNLSVLSDNRDINCVVDFTDASIVGDTFNDWVSGEPDWADSYNEICSKFRRAFNKITDRGKHPHRIGTFQGADYSLVMHVLKATHDGSKVTVRADIVTRDGEILFSRELVGKNGRYGSVANLMSDAFEEIGTTFGMNFVRYAK